MNSCKEYSWVKSPEPIKEEQIAETITCDAVICGAGMSGCAAALSSVENGLKTVLLEKGSTFSARGYHFGTANSRLLRANGIVNDVDAIAAEWLKLSASRVNETLVRKFLIRSEEGMDWLLDKTEAHGIGCYLYGGQYRGPYYREVIGTHLFDGGAEAVVGMLLQDAKDGGCDVRFRTPALSLLQDENGRVTGVIAKDPDGRYLRFRAEKGVVLSTGDICGSPEMMKDLSPAALHANSCLNEHAWLETGDGIKMGLQAGAKLGETPFPCTIHMMTYFMFTMHFLSVDRQGLRYMNEDTWTQGRTTTIIRRDPEHPWAYVLLDADWKEQAEKNLHLGGGIAWDFVFRPLGDTDYSKTTAVAAAGIEDALEQGGDFAVQADTLEELARQMGVPEKNLLATVRRYNELAAKGHDDDFGKRSEFLSPIVKPPFTAVKCGGSLLNVIGGVEVNENLQVLNRKNVPIPGLYAIGNCMSGLYAVDYPLLLSGNSHGRCITFGYLAGRILKGIEGPDSGN